MQKSHDEEVDLHLKNLGGLHKFFKQNLHFQYPDMEYTSEFKVKDFYKKWLLESGFKNDEEKSQKFRKLVEETMKVMGKHFFVGDFHGITQENYYEVYDKDFRNTSDFL